MLINDEDIFGRKDDTNKIIDYSLDPNVKKVLSIVGMGGLLETALARLVYNDPRKSSPYGCGFVSLITIENNLI